MLDDTVTPFAPLRQSETPLDVIPQVYGPDRLRLRFVQMLAERQSRIAAHALAAWDGESVEEVNINLSAAQFILSKIARSAGPLGFSELAQTAQHAADQVLNHLKGPDSDLAICPGELVFYLDESVAACRAAIAAA